MLLSKNLKFNKKHFRKQRIFNKNNCSNDRFSGYSLIALESGKINSNQVENLQRVINRVLNKDGKVFVRLFSNSVITKKPNETRMGKGKGNIKTWVCLVNEGQTLFEIKGCN